MMKKLITSLLALVALAMPARAILYEISGPVDGTCYGDTYTLNGVTYKIYAECDVYGVWTGIPDNIYPQKFVAFVTSLEGVTTEECVIPATFENTHIAFTVGRIVINDVLDYKYVYTTSPNFGTPGTGGHEANQVSPTVEVWGFSSKFASSGYGYQTNSNIKTLRFEGDMRYQELPVYVYDDETTVAYIQEAPSSRNQYFYKQSYTEGTHKFTEPYKPSLPNLETLYIHTLTGYGESSLAKFPALTDVYFTSTTPYHASSPQFYGVSDMVAHLTNEAFAGYLPDDTYGYFYGFKRVLPESVNVVLSVENGAYVEFDEQLYPEGEYTITVTTPDSLYFHMCDGSPSRAWLNGKEVSSELKYVDFLINDYETYEYTVPSNLIRPTMYVRCRANDELVTFADPAVQSVCVNQWDENGDGRLSKLEAANVTSLGEAFKGNTDIQHFDELQYFTNLTSIGNKAFDGCTGLKHVTLSENIKTLGQYAFRSCALTEIDLPDGLTSFASYTFAGCRNLETIDIPSGVTILPMQCFVECTGLKHLYIPKTCVRLSQYPFGGCTGLSSIVVEDGNPALSSPKGCNALVLNDTLLVVGCKNSSIPEGIKGIYNYAFYDMAELTSIELPATLTTISQRAFQNCTGLTSVVSHVREPFTFGTGAFGNISPSCVLTVPHGTRQAYIDKGWTETVFKGGIVEMPLNCDVNQDGTVSVADVTTVVNSVLGR